MYIEKKTSNFEGSNTSFLFHFDFVFGSRNGLLLLSSDSLFCSYMFGFVANISTTNVVLIREKNFSNDQLTNQCRVVFIDIKLNNVSLNICNAQCNP
jgi:predicted nuclease of predicted toxin-antitoxin system